jgi:hypothetical protein
MFSKYIFSALKNNFNLNIVGLSWKKKPKLQYNCVSQPQPQWLNKKQKVHATASLASSTSSALILMVEKKIVNL